ncbi:hypothetical protein [Agrococcus terreus]|uniref:Uncharacterized protein n=1 Tax=Agrococcus terreus TaxID=574649 RepID=A0ABQ2KDL3_9MICO|nr:hypothetical protein [Agrococcus terreus]GGN80087.1 hypothetical protein GCM10010968_07660 [Agrococcus terreus]
MLRRPVLSRLVLPAATAVVLAVGGCSAAGSAPSGSETPLTAPTFAPTPSSAADASSGAAADSTGALEAQRLPVLLGEAGVPAGSGASVDDVLRLGAVVLWADPPGTFSLSVPAAEECWPTALPAYAAGGAIGVDLIAAEGCAVGDAVRTFSFDVPDGVEVGDGVDVVISGLEAGTGTAALPAP